jgi:hypothetical protein
MNRRGFLATISCSLTPVVAAPLLPTRGFLAQSAPSSNNQSCWLEVCAPFIVEDPGRRVQSEIVLTSDTFAGARGHEDGADSTDYEIYLYDATGKAIGAGGIARKLNVPAMRTTVIATRDLVGETKSFWGGMKIRLRPRCRETMHASDLFSSAFVCWRTAASLDNVHANPDPRQWQNTESFFYSMPFPSLADYECLFSLFNPNDQRSAGEIVMFDPNGKRIVAQRYDLRPHASLLFDLNAGAFGADPWLARATGKARNKSSGLLGVTNEQGTAKSFGYLMIRQNARQRFSVEHPIHQGIFKPKPSVSPFDANNQFKAKNVLYTPLVFKSKRIGDLTLDSRFYFGTGLPLEEAQWFYPFAVDAEGEVAWSAMNDAKLAECLPTQTERGLIKLASGQSCALDVKQLALPQNFSGGLGVAVSPDTTHTLLKVEVRVAEWGAFAFTHFRPGLRSARSYQKPKQRGGLATDYIVSGARLVRSKNSAQLDELITVLNIDDQGLEAHPVVELFGARGLITRIQLGAVVPFACRHFLLSKLIEGEANHETLTLRLVDERATLLMSAVHLDYGQRDIALDHGSDRFSTFLDYGCQ